jgi:hypothetical protein
MDGLTFWNMTTRGSRTSGGGAFLSQALAASIFGTYKSNRNQGIALTRFSTMTDNIGLELTQ